MGYVDGTFPTITGEWHLAWKVPDVRVIPQIWWAQACMC